MSHHLRQPNCSPVGTLSLQAQGPRAMRAQRLVCMAAVSFEHIPNLFGLLFDGGSVYLVVSSRRHAD